MEKDFLPATPDVLGKLVQVGEGIVFPDDALQPVPEILDGVTVTALTNPLKEYDIMIPEPSHHSPAFVARSAILLEQLGASLLHGSPQVLLQNVDVHVKVHFCIGLHKIKISKH